MLRYNKELLDTAIYRQAFVKWIKEQLLHGDRMPDAYKNRDVSYKTTDWLKRAGLYLVSLLAVQSSVGFVWYVVFQVFLLSLQIDSDGTIISFMALASGIALFLTLNKYLLNNRIYKQGTDDAWLHTAFGISYFALMSLIDMDTDTHAGMLFAAVSLCCFSAFAAYQYSDSFIFIICMLSLNYIPLYLISMINQGLLFFAVLWVVPFNLFVIRLLNKWDQLQNHYWYWCFITGRVVACLMMYLSINLYVIRTLAYELMGAETIPLQPLFLTFTIITPLVFIAWGIRKKHRYLLYCGLFLLLPTVATIRYYYAVMPVELACMIGGLVVIVVCYLAIRYLRHTESDYTFEPDYEHDFSDAEVLLLLQQFGKTDSHQPASETSMNGGAFGGGGSGGGF